MTASILIAGTSSGVGKTTITTGLIAALRRRGLRVQPFKAGPDYIDPTYHALAAGRPCRNIDTWMVPSERALALFNKAAHEVDLAVIEGVMGVFDGFSYENEEGSSAQIAKLVNATVLLVLDVGKMARSAGAIASGYTNFDPALNIAGFVLNRCGSESHFQGVKLAVETATARPVLGWLPKDAGLHIPERHLGLVPTNERGELAAFIAHAADIVENYFDLDQIVTIAKAHSRQPEQAWQAATASVTSAQSRRYSAQSQAPKANVQIAVARDEAFSFYYEDNLDLLRECGAEILFFSPQSDTMLPPGTGGIYLGGGFPEIYAAQLAANKAMHRTLQQAYAAGVPIYAECGGFMYLTQAIIDLAGQPHPMVGLVPGITHMQPRLMSLGYRTVESPAGNFLLPKGAITRGHEFHWSSWEPPSTGGVQSPTFAPAWHIQPRHGPGPARPDGYANGNLIASYVHLHFAHNLNLAPNFVQACRQRPSQQGS